MLDLLACATCRPDPSSVIAQAQDSAVLVMLGVLVLGLGCVALILVHLIRKQQRRAAAAGEV
jgi:CHASE1-domain containing sensor protein